MKQEKFSNLIRSLLILSGLMLFAILFVPMWRIDLDAPQYPEGLRLLIFANKLGGSVDIINGLNHYIGMKTLHTADFVEFKILPYMIVFFGLFFIVTGMSRNRKLMYVLLSTFILFGIVAMADFWKWEYDYGHNLNPDAAIIVPGMAYQPPLIGFKQLLNFGAYSVPDIGGWLFIVAGVVLVACVFFDYRLLKKSKKLTAIVIALILSTTISSCSTASEPIKLGTDNCSFCQMTISNSRFGAEIVTKKGKAFKYDDLICLSSDIKKRNLTPEIIKDIYSTDFCGTHQLTNIQKSFFMQNNDLRSPMGGNVASFANLDSLNFYVSQMNGKVVSWEMLSK